MTVGELLERVSSDELTEWAAFYQIKARENEKARKEAEAKAKRRR